MPDRTPPIARYRVISSRLGRFTLTESIDGEFGAMWQRESNCDALRDAVEDQTMHGRLAERLAAYFDGDLVTFDDVPTPAGSPFFVRCWAACRTIPRGQTRSYAELAEMAGGERGAARAAGQAMRHNPLPVIVPCHRVVNSTGGLHGFSGSVDPAGDELALKDTLLKVEGRTADRDNLFTATAAI